MVGVGGDAVRVPGVTMSAVVVLAATVAVPAVVVVAVRSS
jgi:hypothetical protein